MIHWEKIFKAGTHTDANGITITFDQSKLREMETLYNDQPVEDKHKAPVVLGHPEDDASSPAFGWVQRLKAVGDDLYAELVDVKDDLVGLIQNGHYKNKSAAFYPNGLLRHLGILGATPPAIKGLPELDFSAFSKEYSEYKLDKKSDLPLTYGEQSIRSNTYGISIKEAISRSEKPTEYADLNDNQFADPVHYRFPLTPSRIRGSLAVWNKPKIQSVYSEKEKAIISRRLIEAALGQRINLNEYTWAYAELDSAYHSLAKAGKYVELRGNIKSVYDPITKKSLAYGEGSETASPQVLISADKLSNKQLLDVLDSLVNNKPINKQFKEATMNTMSAEQFDALAVELLAKIGESYQEEMVGQVSGFIEELKSDPKYWTITEPIAEPTPAEGNQPSNPFSEADAKRLVDIEVAKVRKEYSEKLTVLEHKDRLNGYNSYCEEQEKTGRVLPKQRPLIITTLEAVRNIQGVKFAENSKVVETSGQQLVKKLIESFPTQVEYGETYKSSNTRTQIGDFVIPPNRTNVEVVDSFGTLYAEMQAAKAESEKAGKPLTDAQAMQIARKKINV